MLTLIIPQREFYDEASGNFETFDERKLVLEHSLLSISKWEERWNKPFLGKDEKTKLELSDYIRCMEIDGGNVDDDFYSSLPSSIIKEVYDYISSSRTATKLPKRNNQPSREVVTSELIYFWMVSQNIPFSCEKWNLNRLLVLINICIIKNTPGKKMSRSDVMHRNARLNAQRRNSLQTSG